MRFPFLLPLPVVKVAALTFDVTEWFTREDLRKFQASSACVEFLRNLPERKEDAVIGPQLAQRTLDDGCGELPSRAIMSRFLLCKHSTEAATRELNDIVTLTALSVPRADAAADVDGLSTWRLLAPLIETFEGFMPPTPPGFPFYYSSVARFNAIWLVVLEQDRWAKDVFANAAAAAPGDLGEGQDDGDAVIVFMYFAGQSAAGSRKSKKRRRRLIQKGKKHGAKWLQR